MDDLIREMIEPRRSSLDRHRRSRLAATAATVGLAALGVTSLTTSALFTDQQTMAGTGFTTGTVHIVPSMSQSVTLGDLDMAPGDTSYGVVSVRNDGSLQHRYTVSVEADNASAADLAGQLEMTVWATGSGGTVAGACRSGGTGALTELADLDAVPTARTEVIGSTTTGQQAGDRVLSAGASEDLCVAVHLPTSTGNPFQGASTEVRLTFDAEQTDNT